MDEPGYQDTPIVKYVHRRRLGTRTLTCLPPLSRRESLLTTFTRGNEACQPKGRGEEEEGDRRGAQRTRLLLPRGRPFADRQRPLVATTSGNRNSHPHSAHSEE